MDVVDWLRSLGLGQYETLFRENDIDAEVLSDLTDGDLEKFGVSFGAKLGDRDAGTAELRQALADYASQGCKASLPFYHGLLAEIEAERGRPEAAMAEIDEALVLAGETEEHWFDAALHRIRGEILLKQSPADPAPAETAFLAAIAVAQQQRARSFELRAALSLAKLYQATGRPTEAHDVLGPALEGFSPTPEFPQIAEAIGFMATVKTAGE